MNMVPEFISRKQGRTKIAYELPELEGILKETYGVIVYQEQVMQIAGAIGNYTMAEADTLRKVMSKKKAEEMEKEKPKFLSGAKIKKIAEQKARKIWDRMETFAQYGFNKSHSTAYAMISYQTAYLKAHYPAEFLAALLTSEKDNRDKIIKHIASCKDMGIFVLPPDINESKRDFSVSGDKIRFGLSAVKNVGVGAIDTIIEARDRIGKFRSFNHFCEQVDLRKVNKRVIESLIKCGAFDAMGYKRRPLMSSYEEIMELALRRHREKSSGQSSIFDQFEKKESADPDHSEAAILRNLPEWESGELLAHEKEMLGFYITGHPLSKFTERLAMVANTDTVEILEKKDKEEVRFAGVVSNIRKVTTKKKDLMAYVTFEDLKGSVTVIFFADVYRKAHDLLHGEEPVLIKGVVDVGEDSIKVIATEALPLSEALDHPFQTASFRFNTMRLADDDLESLRNVLKKYPGKAEGYIHLLDDQSETVIHLGKNVLFAPSNQLKEEADRILGAGATQFR
jgi:DNA polymerase-3 subunit alpha